MSDLIRKSIRIKYLLLAMETICIRMVGVQLERKIYVRNPFLSLLDLEHALSNLDCVRQVIRLHLETQVLPFFGL